MRHAQSFVLIALLLAGCTNATLDTDLTANGTTESLHLISGSVSVDFLVECRETLQPPYLDCTAAGQRIREPVAPLEGEGKKMLDDGSTIEAFEANANGKSILIAQFCHEDDCYFVRPSIIERVSLIGQFVTFLKRTIGKMKYSRSITDAYFEREHMDHVWAMLHTLSSKTKH